MNHTYRMLLTDVLVVKLAQQFLKSAKIYTFANKNKNIANEWYLLEIPKDSVAPLMDGHNRARSNLCLVCLDHAKRTIPKSLLKTIEEYLIEGFRSDDEDLQVACVPCVTKSFLDFQKATFPNLFHHGIIIHLCNTTGVLVRVNASVNCASNQRFVLGRDMPPQKPKEKI